MFNKSNTHKLGPSSYAARYTPHSPTSDQQPAASSDQEPATGAREQ